MTATLSSCLSRRNFTTLLLLFCFLSLATKGFADADNTPLLCRMADGVTELETVSSSNTRIVAVADIHGAHDELMRILDGAGIINTSALTSSSSSCEWITQPPGGTTLVQMGDIVDRGPGATEAWECLETLQQTAPAGSEVIRLVGNHELWWLEGHYHDRNKATDSIAKCKTITQKLRDGIQNESIVASFVRHIGDVPVMFVHAGYRRDMISFLKKRYSMEGSADELSAVTNKALRDVITSQAEATTVALPRGRGEEIFEAGAERGGSHIGGPFWTDFKVLQKEYNPSFPPDNMMQIVGHTAQHGSFRGTNDLSALCIDAAMYTGTSTFLEIGYDKHFRLHIWNEDQSSVNKWEVTDVTMSKCSAPSAQQ